MNKDVLLATVSRVALAIFPTGTDLIKYAVCDKTAFVGGILMRKIPIKLNFKPITEDN